MGSIIDIEDFVARITNFDSSTFAEKIDYFTYYLLKEKNNESIKASDICTCFEVLSLKPYTNIPGFLSSKSKGKGHTFIKKKMGYVLERKAIQRIGEKIGVTKQVKPTNNYFDFSLFDNTRGYLQKVAKQALSSYDYGLFDACFVMTRKLLETLIIELFERRRVEATIKNNQGQYFYLSDLLGVFLNEKSWTLSRNTTQGIIPIKKVADLSAHNRRFCATKTDVDNIKLDLRIVVEELIHLIDYPTWK